MRYDIISIYTISALEFWNLYLPKSHTTVHTGNISLSIGVKFNSESLGCIGKSLVWETTYQIHNHNYTCRLFLFKGQLNKSLTVTSDIKKTS